MLCSCFPFRHIHRIGLGQGNGGRQYGDGVRRYTNGITALFASQKNGTAEAVPFCAELLKSMMLVRALVAHAEVELLHALDLVADVLELADRAVRGQTLHDMGQGVGDGIRLLCIVEHCGEIKRGIGNENDLDIQDVGVFFVRLDIAIADLLEVYAALECLLGNADLLAVALRRHTHHVALGVDVILAKFDILECAVDLLVLALKNADAQQNDTRKGDVLLDGLEVGAVKQDLIFVDELRARGGADVVCRAETESAELIRGVRLQNELRRAEVRPCLAGLVAPNLGSCGTENFIRAFYKRIVKFHAVSPLTLLFL